MVFADGLFYEYMGHFNKDTPTDNMARLIAFAKKGYLLSNSKGKIPISVDPYDKLWSMLMQEISESGGLLNVLLMRDEVGGEPNY